MFPGHLQTGHEHPEVLVRRRVRELQLQGDGVGLTHHEVMSPGLQLDGDVGITAGARSVWTVTELEVDVFFVNLETENNPGLQSL